MIVEGATTGRTIVSRALPALLLAAVALAYVVRLHNAPIYLSPDEATIAVDAQSLASTGHDIYGRSFPLYFQVQVTGESRMGWFTPAIFYVSALFLKVLPFSEWSVRLPTACIGVIDMVLMWLIGRRVFRNERLAVIAAGLLAMTPAHFILSRFALDYVYPLPFMLAWLLCLLNFLDSGKPITLFAATTFLGLGFYSYIASVVMMPLYFALTCLVLFLTGRPARSYAVAALGFGWPLLFLLVWLAGHPGAFADTVQRYALYDAKRLNPIQGLREFLSFPNIDRMASLYWSYLSPAFLFLSGDRAMMFSTRTIGVFLLPVAVLLPFGLLRIFKSPYTPVNLLIVAGFFTGPAAAVLGAEDAAVIRAVALLPFGALLATVGVEALWSAATAVRVRRLFLPLAAAVLALGVAYALWRLRSHSRVGGGTATLVLVSAAACGAALRFDRLKPGYAAAVLLLALVPVQFGFFLFDYFGDYQARVSYWLGGNLRGGLEELIDRASRQQAPRVYLAKFRSTSGLLDTRNRWIDVYWNFYLIKHRRQDLLERTVFIDPQYRKEVESMPAGSLVLGNLEDTTTAALVKDGVLKWVSSIPEVDRAVFFSILQR
jgi:4-amino-4-deoxy-L-arabinose transferase-like glycosyltransferase